MEIIALPAGTLVKTAHGDYHPAILLKVWPGNDLRPDRYAAIDGLGREWPIGPDHPLDTVRLDHKLADVIEKLDSIVTVLGGRL